MVIGVYDILWEKDEKTEAFTSYPWLRRPFAAIWHTVSPCNKKHTSLSSMTVSATLMADLDVCSSIATRLKYVLRNMSIIGCLCESISSPAHRYMTYTSLRASYHEFILQRTCELILPLLLEVWLSANNCLN